MNEERSAQEDDAEDVPTSAHPRVNALQEYEGETDDGTCEEPAEESEISLSTSSQVLTSPTSLKQQSLELLHMIVRSFKGEPRQGQDDMLEAVCHALENEGHLLVQAGTGTGKSLGYLVPAAAWAMKTEEKVVVSTATLALQRQILSQDVPRLESAFEQALGKSPKVTVLKGWNNYICMRRAADVYAEDDSLISKNEGRFGATDMGREVARAQRWAYETETGDRDDLVPGVSELVWRQVSVAKSDCLGKSCAFYAGCFPVLAREAAEEADVVVTNHAMLALESTGLSVLPEAHAYIVDEAHELVDRVTSQLTMRISPNEIDSTAKALRRSKILATDLSLAGEILESALADIPLGLLDEFPQDLTDALLNLDGTLERALDDISSLPASQDEEVLTKSMLRTRVKAMSETIDHMLEGRSDYISWIEAAGNEEESRSLTCAPLDISASLADELFADRGVVLTSATLSIGDSFDHIARQTGLMLPSQPRHQALNIASPFTYEKSAFLYNAAHLPQPFGSGISQSQLEEIVDLIRASRGGALGLFSSRSAMEEAAEYVRGKLDIEILVQGEEQLPTLIDGYSSDPHSCLFGTLSLWQGVDVPGLNSRLVIIDRIPFPFVKDPLVLARTRAAEAAKRSGFFEVSLSRAALLLAQGAGRLIRSQADKGVVAVLDSRLSQKSYGRLLTATMPPMFRTTDKAHILHMLDKLALRAEAPLG